ncbi:hypothetical protein Tco_0744845 [Tanacetum coccineum]
MYIVASTKSISDVLLAEREERQVLIYFIGDFEGEHDIEFKGRDSVKGQILVDFLTETPFIEDKDTNIKKPEAANKVPKSKSTWKLYTNGASSFDCSGAGLMLVSLQG